MAFLNRSQGLKDLKELASSIQTEPFYALLYLGDIDSVGHRKGIDSKEFEDTILQCLDQLEQEFVSTLHCGHKKGALLLSADHGMVSVYPRETLYINLAMPSLLPCLQKDRQGKILAPAGSCRDLFLHVKQECVSEVVDSVRSLVQGKAEVYQTKELIEEGVFGKISQRLLDRVGNVVVLPYEDHSVWWFEQHTFEQHFFAAHGGLTPHELETLFLFVDL